MSHFLDRLTFFNRIDGTFADGHGITTREDRRWEDGYRKRWQHDKIVRSTHGANCTGSCSWKIYVKGGIVTWETQQTDYPRTRPDLPNHEPRGCSRGASYSWYLYSGNRVKYPLVRSRLIKLWREARATRKPVAAWASIVENPEKRAAYTRKRGLGGFVRATWDEVTEIIAAANAYTVKTYGPDRVFGFSPIPAMSMVSYAAGSRYLSLLGGVCMSFYDWYCDLPPSSPQTWGEQTDVPESADWYNAGFLILWGSNVPQTRTPDAHFYTEVRYKGTKSVVICPDYSEASKFADMWLSVKQGTDAALAMAMGHVILKEFHVDRQVPYFEDYARKYTDMPMLVRLVKQGEHLVPERLVRASDFESALGETNNPEWKTVAFDETSGDLVVPNGSVGFRWGEKGKWNLEEKESSGAPTKLRLSLAPIKDDIAAVAFPYFGNREHDHFAGTDHPSVLPRNVPVKTLKLKDGEALVASVYDLFLANYGVDRGFGGAHVASSYDDNEPYTPAWAERISGVKRDQIVQVAREFARNAEKTNGRSMVIIGAAMNHWFHCDMNYRGVINMLVMCGCVGQSGGGWSHYVGQEKLRPQSGWLPLAFALDWGRPPRQQNSTSSFYAHTDQWRYETLDVSEIVSPTAPAGPWDGALIDYNVRAERMGWLPSAPQLETNPLEVAKQAAAAGKEAKDYVAAGLKSGELKLSCHDPDNPKNWPRNLFVWRSNLLGSSGKGHEYFLKHLLGTTHGVMGKELGAMGARKPSEVVWREEAPEGKLDLLVTLDFRMSTTCVYSDIVLPTATWYEKNDLNTSDMHPFIHPLTGAVDPVWEAKSDWEIYKAIAKKFSQVASGGAGRRAGCGAHPHPARHAGRDGAGPRRQGLEARRVRADPRQDHAGGDRGRARLSQPLQALHVLGPADVEARQRRQGHGLEYRARGRFPEAPQRRRHRGGPDQGPAQDRQRHRCRRGDPHARAGDQRRGGREGLGGARQDHGPRPHASRHPEGGREDPLPRRGGPAAQDHLLADLVGPGIGEGLLQRRLHQRARADPLAHAHRPPAALPGPSVDARLRRGARASTARPSTRARSSR